MKKIDPKIRFNSKYVIKDDGCWDWTDHCNYLGYGCMSYGKTAIKAHRLSFIIYKGEIPKGLHVLHKCDNRRCVNPEHLFLGTHKDNMKDKSLKCRAPFGQNHWASKISDLHVIVIREAINNGYKQKNIASYFRLKPCTISQINTGLLHHKSNLV